MSIKTTLEQIGAAAQKLKNEATAGGSQMHYIGDVIGDLVEVTEQIHSQMENGSVSDDELAAIQGANSPNATNSFATMNDLSDISGLSIQSAVVVETTSNAKTNGAALIAAYTAAKALTPNGEELSATNRASVIIPPGVYDLGSGEGYTPLTLDTEFVDLIGLTSDRKSQHIKGTPPATNSGVIVQTANNVHISNLTVEILTESEEVNWDHTDSAAYFPSTNLSNTVIDNCEFIGEEGGDGAMFAMRLYIEYSGTFNSCVVGLFAFGGGGTASGTFNYCTGGVGAFGGSGTASGTFNYCTGGEAAFGGGGVLSGKLYYCRLTVGSFQTLAEGGKLRACIDGSDTFIAMLDYGAPC
jgi:hypothetical protein